MRDGTTEFSYANQSEWQFLTGMMQSPIAIETSEVEKLKDQKPTIELDYSYKVDSVEMYKPRMQINGSGSAIINSRKFELQQYHFHAPSEHTIDGARYPVEAHFVHEALSGRKAVIAVFFKVGAFNLPFERVLQVMMKIHTLPIHAMAMIPKNKSYYHYLGSLTTPPLMENAEWYVMKQAMEISKKQLEKFHEFYKGNHRDIHDRNGRRVLEYDE